MAPHSFPKAQVSLPGPLFHQDAPMWMAKRWKSFQTTLSSHSQAPTQTHTDPVMPPLFRPFLRFQGLLHDPATRDKGPAQQGAQDIAMLGVSAIVVQSIKYHNHHLWVPHFYQRPRKCPGFRRKVTTYGQCCHNMPS